MHKDKTKIQNSRYIHLLNSYYLRIGFANMCDTRVVMYIATGCIIVKYKGLSCGR